jgi:hypothetical protein
VNDVREICDPTTGWSRIEPPPAGQAGQRIEILHDLQVCVGVAWGGASPVAGFTYYGMQGRGFLGSDGKTVSCDLTPGHQIELETDRPECAPWNWNGAGHLMPELACDTTVPGPCDTAP